MILNWAGGELGYLGLQPLIRIWGAGSGAAAIAPASARDDLTYDQIRVSDRTGNGAQLLTWTIPAPVSAASAGSAGQIAYDGTGNFYFCYAPNQWAKLGPAGYSNSF